MKFLRIQNIKPSIDFSSFSELKTQDVFSYFLFLLQSLNSRDDYFRNVTLRKKREGITQMLPPPNLLHHKIYIFPPKIHLNGTQFRSRQRLPNNTKKQKLFISWFFRYLFYSFYLLLRVSLCRLFIITSYLQIVIWAIRLNVLYIVWAHKQAYLPHVIWRVWHIILMNNKISLVTNSLSCYQTGKFPINFTCVPPLWQPSA